LYTHTNKYYFFARESVPTRRMMGIGIPFLYEI
jgi:hypothetical protein